MMNTNKYLAACVAGLTGVLSSAAKADLPSVPFLNLPVNDRLAGWYDFTYTLDNITNPADEAKPGLTTKGIALNTGAGPAGFNGNSDNVFGSSDWNSLTGSDPNFNGAAQVGAFLAPTRFSLTNGNAEEVPIGYLLFDLRTHFNPATVKISYESSHDGNGDIRVTTPISEINTSDDYSDYNFDLRSLGIKLAQNESITFIFDASAGVSDAYLDNVAIAAGVSPIPEPGSMLAVACFLGSGLLIRRNRRSLA
jgi:hypothetical protein